MTARRSEASQETEAIGAEVARGLEPGDVVLVEGELGSGKSTFVRGALRALGVTGAIPSPTFTIGRRYEAGDRVLSHLDLYRLEDLAAEDPALLGDYLSPEAIAFIEWPDAAGELELPAGVRVRARVSLAHAGGDRRELTIAGPAGL